MMGIYAQALWLGATSCGVDSNRVDWSVSGSWSACAELIANNEFTDQEFISPTQGRYIQQSTLYQIPTHCTNASNRTRIHSPISLRTETRRNDRVFVRILVSSDQRNHFGLDRMEEEQLKIRS